MEKEIVLQIILAKPPKGVDFALQQGSGNKYETIQKQTSMGQDLIFNFSVIVKGERQKDAIPKFTGHFVQGPAGGKFIYIDIGVLAGQIGTIWERRLKVPLYTITWEEIDKLLADPKFFFETIVPGTGRDGGPNCATVKPFDGWRVRK